MCACLPRVFLPSLRPTLATGPGAQGEPDGSSVRQLLQRREALRAALYDRETPPLLVLNEASARGIDLKINVVFLWDLPLETASYLHMAGRTGRAGQASSPASCAPAPRRAAPARVTPSRDGVWRRLARMMVCGGALRGGACRGDVLHSFGWLRRAACASVACVWRVCMMSVARRRCFGCEGWLRCMRGLRVCGALHSPSRRGRGEG